MAADKTKAMVLAFTPGRSGSWIAYTVPLSAFTPISSFASGATTAAALASLADGKSLDVGADGTASARSPLRRWNAAVIWSTGSASGWTVAVGDVASLDGRIVVAERPDFAGILAAASAAWS